MNFSSGGGARAVEEDFFAKSTPEAVAFQTWY